MAATASQTRLVLLVEDLPGDVALVQQTFIACGIDATLVPVASVVEAFNLLTRRSAAPGECPCEMILLDLNLPLLDGLPQGTAGEPSWRGLRVVVLSPSAPAAERAPDAAPGATSQPPPATWAGFADLGRQLRKRIAGGAGQPRPHASPARAGAASGRTSGRNRPARS